MKRFCALRQSRKITSHGVLGCADGNGTVLLLAGLDERNTPKKCDRVHWISSQSVLMIKRLRASIPRVLCSLGLGPLL